MVDIDDHRAFVAAARGLARGAGAGGFVGGASVHEVGGAQRALLHPGRRVSRLGKQAGGRQDGQQNTQEGSRGSLQHPS